MDLIFYNGHVWTGDNKQTLAQAAAVKNDKIFTVGSNEEILSLKENSSEVVDLKGRSLLPGFNDSHMHLIGHALTRAKVDLRQCASLDEVVSTIRAFIDERGVAKGEWVYGWGWDQGQFREERMPCREDLDRASTEHCIAITRTCCHILSANSMALQKAGIDREAPVLSGGKVAVDDKGVPTGVLEENAMQLVNGMQPSLDEDALKKIIAGAVEDFLAAGLTSVQTDDLAHLGSDLFPVLCKAYRELETEGKLPLRVNLQCLLPTEEELKWFLDCGYRTGQGGVYFKIGPLKLLTDGSLGARTALLSEPYSDMPENRGVAVLTSEKLEKLVNLAAKHRMQVAAHAIGDAAVEMVLDAYKKAAALYPRSDARYRVIHASLVRPEQIDRFVEQAVIADVQPAFATSDYMLIEQHFDAKFAGWAYRFKGFIDRGIKTAGGSDCPVENYFPLEGIHAAVTRQDKSGNPPGGWIPEQCLTLDEALSLYTTGSAYSSFEEEIKGSITPGKLADLVVLSEDITKVDPGKIKALKADMTVVGGKIVYSRS